MRLTRAGERWRLPGRHPFDRTILALGLPALGALAADPLYSLVDTAFVGNLGTEELGAVAVGTAAFTASFWLFSFLAYGVTPRVARFVGANDDRNAARIGVQALLMAVAIGAVPTSVISPSRISGSGCYPRLRFWSPRWATAGCAERRTRGRRCSSRSAVPF
jgi:Na+-driven multidrug efflux pump